jgi:predicted CopG family antitoxin
MKMKKSIICEDKYEAQKLASLIYVKDNNETFITGILEIIENELVISLKDKSAHSILLKNKSEAESFADFIQSVIEKINRISDTKVTENTIEITKE